jgi:putative endonuclease
MLPAMDRERVWRRGERAAWDHYRSRGFRLVARNWRSRIGELDLVVAREGLVVFCEVKARSAATLGSPFEAVTARKQRRVRALAEAFLASTGMRADAFRFDVASVMVVRGRPRVHVFEDAF